LRSDASALKGGASKSDRRKDAIEAWSNFR
jgi:hypothetical protein